MNTNFITTCNPVVPLQVIYPKAMTMSCIKSNNVNIIYINNRVGKNNKGLTIIDLVNCSENEYIIVIYSKQ